MASKPGKTDSTAKGTTRFPRTDAGNAELFAAMYKDRLRYDFGRGRWLIWHEHWWGEDDREEVLQLAKAAARSRVTRRKQTTRSGEEVDKEAKWALSSESRPRLEAALKLAASERQVSTSAEQWDANPMLMGMGNGVLDLHTGKLRAGTQSDHLTRHTHVIFDSQAQCPRWLKFVDDIFGGDYALIDYVQKSVGYSLTGSTKEQVLFMCYGTGANGKSTFLEVLRSALGDYAYSLPFSAFELNTRSAIPSDMAALPGRRFVTALETCDTSQLNEARVKVLTGCDPMTARKLYSEWFTFIPVSKFWLAVNHMPRVTDDSPGFWRRIRQIPFLVQFAGDRIDRDLPTKLKSEVAGILNWAVEGCMRWQREGLEPPASVVAASEAYRQENDEIGQFLEDETEIDSGATVSAADLWSAYLSWADQSKLPLDRRAFSSRLQAKGFRKVRTGHDRAWTWLGLRLKTSEIEKPYPILVPVSLLRADADVK